MNVPQDRVVVGMFEGRRAAEFNVDELRRSGFALDQIAS